MSALCPSCGYDFLVDQSSTVEGFTMHGESSPLEVLGQVIPLSRGESSLVWSLMKAYPSPVRHDALLLRMGSEANTGNTLQVLVCRVRRKLREAGIPDPIELVRGRGYRWRGLARPAIVGVPDLASFPVGGRHATAVARTARCA